MNLIFLTFVARWDRAIATVPDDNNARHCTITYWQTGSIWLPVLIHWVTVAVWLSYFGGLDKLNYVENQ